jgi:hypothetical protein
MSNDLSPSPSLPGPVATTAGPEAVSPADRAGWRAAAPGGPAGNARLTALTGLLLLALFAVQGVTVLFIGQLLWLHLFVGLLLAGPVVLKLSSAGYRMARYYTGSPAYRAQGAPALALRGLAPVLVLCTAGLFATGLTLLLLGPAARQPVLLLHQVFFFCWLAVVGLHVIGHLPDILHALHRLGPARRLHAALPRMLTAMSHPTPRRPAGAGARSLALAGSLLAGAVLAVAVVLSGQFHVWTG